MKVEITYPLRKKQKAQRQDIIRSAKWPFLFSAYICPILNICTGGKAWSVIVLWSLWMVWSFILSPALVEYNRISQVIKLITHASILLVLIDALLAPGWAIEVVPIVIFSGLTVAGVLFFTDLDRQKQNMMPMLLLTVLSVISSIVGLIIWRHEDQWALAVMGALAFALLAACFMVLGKDFNREIKKRFHTN